MRILLIIVVLVCCVLGGFFYLGYRMFNPSWTCEATLLGPDGYTYYFMNYSMLQAQIMRLVRTGDSTLPESEREIIGEAHGDYPRMWASIIRPAGASDDDYGLLYLTDREMILGFRYGQRCYFAFDTKEEKFFSGEDILTFSPYLLIQQDTVLHETDVYATIERVALSSQRSYLFSGCPRLDVLYANINNPNQQVQVINRWMIEIHEKGLSTPTDTIHELLDYVFEGLQSEQKQLRLNAIDICGYFQVPYIEKAIPILEQAVYEKDGDISSQAAISLGGIGPNAFPALLRFLESSDSFIRFRGLVGFRVAGPNAKTMVKDIVPFLNDSCVHVRWQAVAALKEIDFIDLEFLELYESLAESRDEGVRDYARSAVRQLKEGN